MKDYRQFKSKSIHIGNLEMGGHAPVRIQSMTNTDTNDIAASVEQCVALVKAGCELIRLTAQGVREAENLQHIKAALLEQGITVPLIADIHFNPKAAEVAAKYVEKVRINPGNYVDKKQFRQLEYSDAEYAAEIDRIEERLLPLIQVCKQHNTAMRIGSNHGSLSDRIISRYGDTPQGMVEAALEFVRICRKHNYHQLVLSMKSSNVKVMQQAYRLLAIRMQEEEMWYPLHLGVTEAGGGLEGRIKSCAGTGALLADGLGDTIRISLSEDPVNEIPVAQKLVQGWQHKRNAEADPQALSFDPIHYAKRQSVAIDNIGGNHPIAVVGEANECDLSPARAKIFYNAQMEQKDSLQNAQLNVIDCSHKHNPEKIRQFFATLKNNQTQEPVILKFESNESDRETFISQASSAIATSLIDGMGDGIWIQNPNFNADFISQLSFGILQACGSRITKSEIISCPTCGRTSFNLEEAAREVKNRLGHLKGLKIGVMGCIVNGPGEMADANYGYVGSGGGKVVLYKGQRPVAKNIPQTEATDKLIELIKENGDWIEA